MAPLSEVISMLRGQAFGRVSIPNVNLSGHTIVVTGANTGLGLACAKHLARERASHIILACRDISKGEKALESIIHETKCQSHTKLSVWKLDLFNYESVMRFNGRVNNELPRLDAFIANAGMELQKYREAEGLEIHLTVNVVSTFLSAIAALPKLRSSAKEHKVKITLTFCGSMYHIFSPDAELDRSLPDEVDMFDALSTSDPTKTDLVWRYALRKLMVHQCYRGLVNTMAKGDWNDVVVNIINPGWCGTELSRAKPRSVGERGCSALIGWTPEKGSRMYLQALTAGRESHGKYLAESRMKKESAYVRSERGGAIGEKMWKDLIRILVKVAPDIMGVLALNGWRKLLLVDVAGEVVVALAIICPAWYIESIFIRKLIRIHQVTLRLTTDRGMLTLRGRRRLSTLPLPIHLYSIHQLSYWLPEHSRL